MRLLDLFCGAGGAAMGYYRAGFTEIVGIDMKPQPRYPFRFIQADALHPPVRLEDFDAIHASPPCQGYTPMSNRWRGRNSKADARPRLIASVRALISSKPYVIENVDGARREMRCPIRLTGQMFDLGVYRPRLFESSDLLLEPTARPRLAPAVSVYGKLDQRRLWTRKDGTELRAAGRGEAEAAMGIDWMEWHELTEAIPPAYTEFIGRQLIAALECAA